MLRMAIALVTLALMAPVPASAQYGYLRPRAVPESCRHNSGHPDCHLDRTYHGRSVAITGGRGYPHYGYGYNCLYYGYAPNCPYYELPDWNGPTEARNPGG